jgi:REP element-mobilizing transposase RayT
MHLNLAGQFVQSCWKNLPNHFTFVELDTFIVMPNHLHGIIIITKKENNVGAKHSYPDVSPTEEMIIKNASPCPDVSDSSPSRNVSYSTSKGTKSGSLAAILQNFKSVSTRKINRMNSTSGETIWQRNYHEHIIRDETSLYHIRHYITNNPKHWAEDSENPQN